MTRYISTLALALVIAIAALAAISLHPERSSAKGNVYVLTGGELGDYAYTYIGIEIPGEGTREAAPPDTLPVLRYDLFHSWSNLAIPYQLARRGAAYQYYPEARLMRAYDPVEQQPIDFWFELSPATAASLDTLIDEALVAKHAGQLTRGAIAADLRERRMAEADYFFAPYGNDALPVQIEDAASEPFIMSALTGTLSQPLAETDGAGPTYRITYEGIFDGGYGFGGELGFYAPPRDGEPGIFWDDGYPSPFAQAYETTAEFDAMVAAGTEESSSDAPVATTSGDTQNATVIASAAGLLMTVALGATAFVLRRL